MEHTKYRLFSALVMAAAVLVSAGGRKTYARSSNGSYAIAEIPPVLSKAKQPVP